jgi:hypothetical protein
MDDFRQPPKIALKLDQPEGRAEYDRLLRRFRQEEEKINRDNLLFGDQTLSTPVEKQR